MTLLSTHEAFADLYAPLSPRARASIDAAFASDALEHGMPTHDQVALVIRSVEDGMTDEQYLAAVLEHLQLTSPR